ncbi:piezo-type mechanosensitive ion channel component isoform X4 [Phlebotomus argentipes]|uniref:piezo-type mechanosensitive ion channel component isoform X4 n=1 Tax=Phlebotomus argentipes TaxID=94469 RepID=UPI00289379E0|nr:piezo-type mechanosensitive ion channel component isoform X4 [Phlebotomus argentipes]
MAKYYGCMLVQRVLFPALLAACCLFRPVALSLLYLLFLFLLPFVPVATPVTIKGRTGTYFKLLILVATLTSLCHGVFESVLLSIGYDKLEFCGLTEKILRHIGFIRLSDLSALSVIVWIAPELVLLLASTGVYFILKMMANGQAAPSEGAGDEGQRDEAADEPSYTVEKYNVICVAAKVLSMAALLLASVMRPSVPSGVYFLMFLGLATWWACYGKLERGFAIISRVIMLFLSIHIIAFMMYQTPWPQEYFPGDNLLPRLLGFVPLFISTCDNSNGTFNGTYADDIRIVNFNTDAPIDAILNPVIILLCFYTLAISSTMILRQKDIKNKAGGVFGQLENGTKFGQQLSVKYPNVPPVARKIGTREKWQNTTRKVKLMRRSTRRMRMPSLTGRNSRDGDGIPMNELEGNEIASTEEDTSGILDSFFTFVQNITGFIFKHCYIFMNIAMMTWSIMYHSWLTFILLIWANVLWIIPNQRKTMLQSSPFVVIYAELLLLAQYIYGMDLNEDELPATIDIKGINLSQIGLVKYTYLPCGPLIMKTIFTLMFWVTLRQMTKERREQRQTSTLADMVAPLQVTVGAATADLAPRADEKAKQSQFITKAAILFDAFLTRFWIWIVVITLFASGIAGQRMTGFRIIYMALFLVFLLTFQVSWKAWKKMMYGFWLTVIIYAMVILVLVYTYQFDRFPQYWSEYLNISETLQGDIGLEKYKTGDLFLHLAIPTIVVVMTVLQLHYFHSKFLALLEPLEGSNLEAIEPNSRQYENLDESDESPKNAKGKKSLFAKVLSLTGLSKQEIYDFFSRVKEKIVYTYETTLLFLDIHLIKLVIFVGFMVCVKEPCFLHIFFTAIIVIAALSRTDSQITISRIFSVIVAVLFLAKMIYQVKYIEHTNYDVICNNETNPNGINNADWFGFHKISENSTLTALLKNYIGYIAIVTIDAIIRYHQKIKRIKMGQSPERPDVMFPEVTRRDAEQNLTLMLQYLANYAFHRFGVEACLIVTVIVIGIRMDIIALFYSIWLCFLFAAKRDKMAMLWPAFQWFSALSIVVQYIVIVGVPPGLCLTYPWSEGILRNLQMWAMLPDATLFKISQKIIPDFILLMLVTRQRYVFKIERDWQEREQEFPGGTNKSILTEIEGFIGKKFENPTPDFTSNVRNWLDVLKRGFVLGFFWLALAIVFLTGANRVNLFSVGYLIGSFTFLWQGSDFYLRPVRTILRWWLRLIAYNVFVVTTKTILQIPGCLFYKTLEQYTCWLIQLLSIVCTQKLKGDVSVASIKVKCAVNADQASILWDVICFAFLVVQYRIFQSYYFCHVVNETKAGVILASRGAELIEELRQKKMKQEMEAEARILKKLKMKMDRIKATQKRLLVPVVEEPKTHAQAIRSGDYYMFEDLDDELELDLLAEPKSDDDVEDQQKQKMQKKMGLGELITTKLNEGKVHKSSESDPGFSTSSFHRRSDRESKKGRKSYQKFDSGRSIMSEPLPSHIGSGEDDDDDVSSKLASKRREDADELDRDKPGPSRQTHAYKSPSDSDDDDDPTERQHLKRSSSEESVTEMDGEEERPRGRLVGLKLIWAFLEGAMISLIIRLNRISRHYRYVVRVLAREKIELKNSPDFGIGRRAGNMMWIPQRINSDRSTESSTTELERHPRVAVSEDDVKVDTAETEDRSEDEGLAANYAAMQQVVMKAKPQEEEEEQRRESVVPEIRILAPSLERGLDEVTPSTAKVDKPKVKDRKFKVDEIEDFSEKEHSSIVELLMACWFAILSNTDLVCYFVVFINQVNSASILSLPLPFMVFCWGTLTVPRPSKTFWVTLIAYTQIVVLLKCVSQFELLWWNEQAIPPNQPLAPARIIGIEKKKNYATYDLALLLVLFFHRFMLKTLGLWKSDFKEEPISEGTYQVNHQQQQQPNNQEEKALVKQSNELERKTDESGSNQAIAITKVHTETILCPSTDMQLVQVTDVKEQPSSIIPPVVKLSFNRHCSAFRIFFGQLLDRSSRVSADVYAYMFFCDFINFMVVLFGFTSFGSQQGDGGVTAYLEENKVPLAFLIMLILQFILIIIDRALYLRKYMLGKIIFQYGLTVGIHIWMFFILPAVTERSFNAKNPPVIWYLIKCFYLLFSAYQIRCGYPTRILGNFLTRSFNFVNLAAYKAYMFIPFLFELRSLMDWIWTDTSMTLFDWLKMEDIFANMYQLKCSRKMEDDFPAPRGTKKTTVVKYLMGGGMLLGLVTIIWFPLGLFALGNTVGESNPPFDVSVTMKIGPFEPIYFANAQGSNIQKFTEDDWLLLNQPYKRDKTAVTFLTNYEAADVAVVDLGPNSTSVWAISPPDLQRMREDIESQDTLKIFFRYTVSRVTYSKENPGVITDETSYDLVYGDPIRQVLSGMLSNQTAGNVSIPHILPKFLKVKNNGVLKPIPQLIPSDYPEDAGYRNITLKLYEADNVRWWELKEDCTDHFYQDILKDIPKANCDSAIVMYTFNDKLFPPTLSYLTGGGIIGMYTTFVIVISRVLRGIFSGSSVKIMFEDLPYVDRVLQLCLDIYLVRESLDFALEEDLFAKLIFLYRSPETMIKWTRPKEEETQGDDDDDDTSSMRSGSKAGGAVKRKTT